MAAPGSVKMLQKQADRAIADASERISRALSIDVPTPEMKYIDPALSHAKKCVCIAQFLSTIADHFDPDGADLSAQLASINYAPDPTAQAHEQHEAESEHAEGTADEQLA